MRLQSYNQTMLLRFAVALNYVLVSRAQCYYPGGKWASDQFPCDKYAYTTLCCPTGWTCFSNNLCIATDPSVVSSDLPLGTSIRGTCTNPEWNDTVCGDFCLNDPVSANNGSIVPCGNNKWCCQPDYDNGVCDCSSGEGTFQVSDGTAQTIIGVVGLEFTSTGSIAPSSAAKSSSIVDIVSTDSTFSISTLSAVSTLSITPVSTVASSTNSHSTSFISTSSSRIASSITKQSSASSASPTAQQILGNSTPVTSSTGFKAGIGTAASLVFVFLVCLLIWRFIARRRQRHQTPEAFSGDSSGLTGRWENQIVSNIPFPVSPNPNPYEDQGYAARESQSVSRSALAEQVAHNRTTPRPRRVFGDGGQEGNPYADTYAGN